MRLIKYKKLWNQIAGIQMLVPSLFSSVTLDKLFISKMGMIMLPFSYDIFVDCMSIYTGHPRITCGTNRLLCNY